MPFNATENKSHESYMTPGESWVKGALIKCYLLLHVYMLSLSDKGLYYKLFYKNAQLSSRPLLSYRTMRGVKSEKIQQFLQH